MRSDNSVKQRFATQPWRISGHSKGQQKMTNRSTIPPEEAELIQRYVSGQRPKPRQVSRARGWFLLLLAFGLPGTVYVGLFPWAFYMGGNFHPLGYWTGWGRMHSKTAGDYFLYVQIFPESRRMESIIPHTFVNGKGSLCTPRNERYSLKLKGSMPPHLYLSTAGQPIALNFDNWRNNLLVGHERRPYFSIRGRWGQREIAGDDDQTLSHAFFPNGTLRPAKSSVLPAETEDIQLTLHEGTYSQWEAACAAAANELN